MFTGVKTTHRTLGYDHKIEFKRPSSHKKATKLESILTWAQKAGMKTGIVTTTRLTHATPAALYAHSASRDWECDAYINEGKVLNDFIPTPDQVRRTFIRFLRTYLHEGLAFF
jgi:alkaline phosphatase